MSFCKNYYVITGFDLTAYKTEKFEEWKWTDEGERYLYFHHKGKIQLFDVDGELYLGYIIGHGNQYDFKTVMFDTDFPKFLEIDVFCKLRELVSMCVIEEKALERSHYKVIVFEECT